MWCLWNAGWVATRVAECGSSWTVTHTSWWSSFTTSEEEVTSAPSTSRGNIPDGSEWPATGELCGHAAPRLQGKPFLSRFTLATAAFSPATMPSAETGNLDKLGRVHSSDKPQPAISNLQLAYALLWLQKILYVAWSDGGWLNLGEVMRLECLSLSLPHI